jgi:hypothetical protein
MTSHAEASGNPHARRRREGAIGEIAEKLVESGWSEGQEPEELSGLGLATGALA